MSILLRAVQTAVHPESEQEGGSDVGLLTKIIHNKASQINEKSLNDIKLYISDRKDNSSDRNYWALPERF